jgi:hypothetical protein
MDAFIYKLKKFMFQNFQPLDFLILLFGFLYGNLFVITFSTFHWDLFLIFSVVLFLEILNKVFNSNSQGVENSFHDKKKYSIQFFEKFSKNSQKSLFILFQLFKRGFLLGFFIEAFKVGS